MALALASGALAAATDDPSDRLPAALRAHGRSILAETDASKRADGLDDLARAVGLPCADFLAAVLDTERDASVRYQIVESLGALGSGVEVAALERRASADPDVRVSLRALEMLQRGAADRLVELVEARLKLAGQNGEQRAALLAAEDHWLTAARGGMLPAFLREPPPPFEVVPAGRPVRAVAFGDFGSGQEPQRQVAAALARAHAERPFDLGITLGDNFYPNGMHSPGDPRWQSLWSELYDGLGIPFYASLGNHDWNLPDSPAAEVLFTRQSRSWHLPATRYTFTAGPAQFFAIDTQALSAAELSWLDAALRASTATWKIVYGHFPIRSDGGHGDTPQLVEQLLPVLAGRAQLYLCGHDHDMQHLTTEQGVSLFVVGSGGAGIRPVTPGPRSLYASSSYGFAALDIAPDQLRIDLVGTDQRILYSYTLKASADRTVRSPSARPADPKGARRSR